MRSQIAFFESAQEFLVSRAAVLRSINTCSWMTSHCFFTPESGGCFRRFGRLWHVSCRSNACDGSLSHISRLTSTRHPAATSAAASTVGTKSRDHRPVKRSYVEASTARPGATWKPAPKFALGVRNEDGCILSRLLSALPDESGSRMAQFRDTPMLHTRRNEAHQAGWRDRRDARVQSALHGPKQRGQR